MKEWTMVAVTTLSVTLVASRVDAQTPGPVQARNVVLVHGAWADGSSWSEVIPRLQDGPADLILEAAGRAQQAR